MVKMDTFLDISQNGQNGHFSWHFFDIFSTEKHALAKGIWKSRKNMKNSGVSGVKNVAKNGPVKLTIFVKMPT